MPNSIREVTFMTESNFWDWLSGKKQKSQNGQDASDRSQQNVVSFYQDLEDFVKSNKSVSLDTSSKLQYSKLIEQIQTALVFLGYHLPKFRIDGLFGQETAAAISQFNQKHNVKQNNRPSTFPSVSSVNAPSQTVVIDSAFVNSLISKLKENKFDEAALLKLKPTAQVTLTSQEDTDFYNAVLTGLGANPTEEKLKFLKAWRQGEGGKAKNNPFNTTKSMKVNGVTNYNTVGVKNYPDRNTGLQATIMTLRLPYYRNLVAMLKDDEITAEELASSPDLTTWGTGDNVKKVIDSGSINPPPIYA